MNTDIRLLLSFRGHPKTKKLRLKLGEAGPLGFIYLLMHVAESKPDGILDGMDREDITLAADYRGDPDEFVDVLLAVRLLDFDGETFSIHDWAANNPWAAGFEERSDHAKKAAAARWKKEKGLDIGGTKKQRLTPKNDAPGINEQCTEQDSALQGVQKGNAPSPSPSPLPPPIPKTPSSTATRFDDWWAQYPKKVEKKKARAIWKRRKLDDKADEILADTLKRPEADDNWKRGFIPNPTTYLNGDRWEDDYAEARPRHSQGPVRESSDERRAREADEYLRTVVGGTS